MGHASPFHCCWCALKNGTPELHSVKVNRWHGCSNNNAVLVTMPHMDPQTKARHEMQSCMLGDYTGDSSWNPVLYREMRAISVLVDLFELIKNWVGIELEGQPGMLGWQLGM